MLFVASHVRAVPVIAKAVLLGTHGQAAYFSTDAMRCETLRYCELLD